MNRTQTQQWHNFTRHIIMTDKGSIQVELYPQPQDIHGTNAYIYALWVDEPYRRQHEATRLLQRAEQVARENGKMNVALEWDARDTSAAVLQQLYVRNGYKEHPNGYGKALLTKTLKP